MFSNDDSKCRVCLIESNNKVSIFECHGNNTYRNLIKDYTGLELSQNDNLPSEICEDCISELMIVVKFISKVRLSNDTLNVIYDSNKNDNDTKDEDDEEKLPLSILGATLKKEKLDLSDPDDTSEAFCFDNNYDDNSDTKIDDHIKEEPDIISLDKLSSFLTDKKNDKYVYVTVNDITIKKECVVPKEEIKVKSTKHVLKKKRKKEKRTEQINTDPRCVILKAEEHGLIKDMVKCLTCGQLLYNMSSFLVHYRRHSGEKPFKCKQCDKAFNQVGGLNEHVKNVHLGMKRLKTLQKRMAEAPDPDENVTYKVLKAQEYGLIKDKVQCLLCRLICENKSAFVVHYRKHTGEKPYKCKHCDKCFPRLGTLNDHIRNIHTVPDTSDNAPETDGNSLFTIVKSEDNPSLKKDMVQCLTCQLMFNDKCAFRIHFRKHAADRPFRCNQCPKCYRRLGDLHDHIRSTHGTREGGRRIRRAYPRAEESCICYACGKNFKHKSSLTIHLRTHTDEKPHECTYCAKRFIRSQELSLHIRIHHTGEKPYSCHLCGKTFAAGTQLKSHMFVHTDEKNFKCKICNTAVKTRDSLAKHMRVMHCTRKNICDVCGAAFAFRYGLRDHMKNRHSDRSETCEICKKSFSDLQKHMITHSDQKPYGCHLCQKGFFRQKSLKAHMLKHHNETPIGYMGLENN